MPRRSPAFWGVKASQTQSMRFGEKYFFLNVPLAPLNLQLLRFRKPLEGYGRPPGGGDSAHQAEYRDFSRTNPVADAPNNVKLNKLKRLSDE